MTGLRFFLAKSNKTGLTKTNRRFFFFFSLIYSPKKSPKVKNVAEAIDFYCSGANEPIKSIVMFPLEHFSDFSDIKWVNLMISDITFSFLSVGYLKTEKNVIFGTLFHIVLYYREPNLPIVAPMPDFFRPSSKSRHQTPQWATSGTSFSSSITLSRNSVGILSHLSVLLFRGN